MLISLLYHTINCTFDECTMECKLLLFLNMSKKYMQITN